MAKHNCVDKLRKKIMKADPTIKYIRFELADLMDANDMNAEPSTGQRVFVGYSDKKKERKTFVAHSHCPFCGERY